MDLLRVTPNEKKLIHKLYNIGESQIKEKIEIIKKWIKGQSYLPQDLTDEFVERLLLRNKFDIGKTKKNLDNYYKLRGDNMEFYENWDIIVPSRETAIFLPVPNLTKNFERIYIYTVQNPYPEFYDVCQIVKQGLAMSELAMRHDYAVGIRFLCDLRKLRFEHLYKNNPFPIFIYTSLLENAYSAGIRGFELINCPPFMHKLMKVIGMALSPKLYKTVRIHENMESLYQVIPQECLPVEYGGLSSNIPDLLKKWDCMFAEHYTFFLENYEIVSRQELGPPNFNHYGENGTFKNLTID